MAFAPIAFTIPEYDRNLYKNWWLKAYVEGTVIPKVMAADATGITTASRFELNTQGFPITSGSALVIPHVDGAYDLWLFPTAAEADANDTTNALQFADNITAVSVGDVGRTFDTVALMKSSTDGLAVGTLITTRGYNAVGDGGGADYIVETASSPDGFGDHILASGDQATLLISQKVTALKFGAFPGVASQQHDALNAAITASHEKFKLLITPDASGNTDYQVNSTVFINDDDLTIEFTGGAHLKPEDSTVLQPMIIGSADATSPSRMVIRNPSVIRPSTDVGTANFGILFKRFYQSTIENPEGRFCKFPLAWKPSTGGNAYNTYINPQAIGGERNFWIEATATGYVNENVFLGGRGFGTSDLETNLYLGGSGLGTGHNRFIGMSLEASDGVQAIFDNGNANEFLQCRTENASGWTSGASHVFGSGCQFPMIMTSRIDYDIDQTAASDPRAQIISYKHGAQFETAINGLTTQTLKNQSASAGSTQDYQSTRDNDDAFAWRAIRLIASESGTHDGASGASVLTDSGASFTVNGLIGSIIFNLTDGSKGMITANTATTITANILGGKEDDWDAGDSYAVYLLNGSLTTSGKLRIRRSVEIEQSGFNFNPFLLGSDYFWIDGNFLRHHGSAPAAATDGRIMVENQTSVAAGLGNLANIVNTTDKYTGKEVFDTGLNRPVWATGSTAGSIWVFSDGTTAYTPS